MKFARMMVVVLNVGEIRRTSCESARSKKRSRPLSRVLSWAAIPLGCASPRSSSDLPGSPCGPHVAAKGAARFPIWSCSRWGLPCRWCCHPRGALLPHHFTLTGAACAALRRYLSVALSVGSRPPGVTWHRALWSPDFPPRLRLPTQRLPGRLLARTIRSFELERALIGLVVAHPGDPRGQVRRLLQRAAPRAATSSARSSAPPWPSVALRGGLGRRAGDHEHDLAAREIRIALRRDREARASEPRYSDSCSFVISRASTAARARRRKARAQSSSVSRTRCGDS